MFRAGGGPAGAPEVWNMPLIKWTFALEVKVRALDADHQNLVRLLNEFYDAAQGGHGAAVLNDTLDRLVEYTNAHFAREEALLEKHDYPELADHRIAHQRLREQVQTYRASLDGATPPSDAEVAMFLKNWLTRHIMTQDQAYSVFLRERGER